MPTASTGRPWPSSTPVARSRPRWAASSRLSASQPAACGSNGSPRAGAPRPGWPAPSSRATCGSAPHRWVKGRRLSADDLARARRRRAGRAVQRHRPRGGRAPRGRCGAPAGGGGGRSRTSIQRGPTQSRVDLLAEAAGVAQRPDRRARAGQPDRPARGLHRLRRPGRRRAATSSRASRSPRTSSTPRRSTRARGSRGFGSHPLVWVAPFIPSPGRGHRQGVGPRRPHANGSRRASGPRWRASARRIESHRLRRRRPRGGRGGAGRLRPPARPARAHPDRRRGQHGPARCLLRRHHRARRADRPPRRAGAPGLDAVAGAHRRDGDPGPADLRRLLEGDGRGPAAAPAAVRRADRRSGPSPSSATAGS